MLNLFIDFLKGESGAITVDWVVLTAALIGLGLAVITTVSNGALDHAGGLGANLLVMTVATY